MVHMSKTGFGSKYCLHALPGQVRRDLPVACHRLPVGANNICELCLRSNQEALEVYLKDASSEWERMNSAWIRLATGSLHHMQATTCCCSASNSGEKVVVQSRDKSIAELLFGLMVSRVIPRADSVLSQRMTEPNSAGTMRPSNWPQF